MVKFDLIIEDIINSEFLSIFPLKLAKEMISAMGLSVDDIPQSTIAAEPEPEVVAPPTPAPEPVAPPAPAPMPEPVAAPAPPVQAAPQSMPMQQPMPPQPMQAAPTQYMAQPTMPLPPAQYAYAPQDPRMITVQGPPGGINYAQANLSEDEGKNLDMLMSVPLEISVEIGRARKPIKDIVSFQQGTLVVLDKLAGEQVDLYVNNQCIAKGDVVVVDDSFGIRITKILDKADLLNMK